MLALVFASVVTFGVASHAGPATPPAPTPQLLDAGKAAYELTCAACHGLTGEGNGPVAFAVKPPPRNFTKDPFKNGDTLPQVYDTITNGLPNTRMVGYPQFTDEQRWGLAFHVLGFKAKKN